MTLAVRSGSISSPSDSESSDEEPLYPHEDEEEHVAASFRPDEIPPESDCAASSDTNPGTDLTDDSTPRRLRRARAVLLHALECVWTVIVAKAGAEGPNERRRHSNAASDLIDRPWTSLSATLGSLQPSLEDELVLAAPYISQSTRILQHFSSDHLLPLAQSRSYARTLVKPEARALRTFAKQFERFTSRPSCSIIPRRLTEDQIELLECTSPHLLARVTRLALSPSTSRTQLNLSRLPPPAQSQLLTGFDLPELLRTFGVGAGDVTHLDLSHNDLHHLPPWQPFPFPNLQVLDVSDNPSLTYLPIRLVTLSQFRRVRTRRTALTPSSAKPLCINSQARSSVGSRPKVRCGRKCGVHSLVAFAVGTILVKRLEDLEGLPSHLEELVRGSYICQLCDQPQVMSTSGPSGWLPDEMDCWTVQVGTGRSGRQVPVRGRICGGCPIA